MAAAVTPRLGRTILAPDKIRGFDIYQCHTLSSVQHQSCTPEYSTTTLRKQASQFCIQITP